MSSRGGFHAYRQSVLGGRASPCGARLTFSSGQALARRVSLSESHSQNLSALFPLSHSHSLSLGPFLSRRHTPLPNNIDFSKSGFGCSLSHTHTLSLSLTQNDTATGKSMEKRTKNPPSFLYIRNNAPLLQQNAKRIEIGMD